MKRLMILTLLIMAGLFVSAQIDNRNQIVRQIAKGDTITSRIYTTYDTYDGTNPILVNYYDSIAFVGSRGLGVGGYTLLYNKLRVNGSQYLGNAVTDTTYLQGRLGINSTGYFSNVAVVGNNTVGATKNMFNFVDGGINKIRTTYAQATDTSSFNMMFTPTGKPLLNIRGLNGGNIINIDSSNNVFLGVRTTVSTTTPLQLNLGGTLNTTYAPSTSKLLLFDNGTTSQYGIDVLSGQVVYYTGANGSHRFSAGTAFIMRFNTNGITISGQSVYYITLNRNTTTNTAGSNFYIGAGSATIAATDKDAGMLSIGPNYAGAGSADNIQTSSGTGKTSVRITRNARAATTGTADNAAYDNIIVLSENNLSDNVAKGVFEVTLPTDAGAALTYDFSIIATDGDTTQTYKGIAQLVFANGNNTITEDVNIDIAKFKDVPAATTDMTVTITTTHVAGTKVTINITADTGFAPTAIKLYGTITNQSAQTITQL